jgi:hypothetical protein
MTLAELFAAFGAAIAAAFPAPWAVHAGPPAATALPAVWPEFQTDHVAGGIMGQVALQAVAAIAAQTSPAEYARLFEARDRLVNIAAADLGAEVGIISRDGYLGAVTIGQTEHTALLYTFTLNLPTAC